jgi:thioredoxin 1
MKRQSKLLLVGIGIAMVVSLYFSTVLFGDNNTANVTVDDTLKTAQFKSTPLPKLIDLGSKSCIPCRKMAPILEDLKVKYKDKADVIFIDVKEDRAASLKHKVTLIPTQIFFDTSGTEVFRHVGFFPADSIIAHFKTLGVEL